MTKEVGPNRDPWGEPLAIGRLSLVLFITVNLGNTINLIQFE